ncbi:hypothetical protein FRC05_009458 [Tulasnella sp. 425]|nr:hypothetical protein FRC05_009458 [Tulasnella sp. 425]
MSSDAEEIDLRQFDHDKQSPDYYSDEHEEEGLHGRRRSKKRKHSDTAVGPLDVYESLGESELEEENARKRKIRRLGVGARRELSGYSQLLRTLETDHVQDVGSHIVNFHRSLVMEPFGAPDHSLQERSEGPKTNIKPSGAKPPNLKSAWPLQPSDIQTPKFSLIDEVRSIAQRHISTQPNPYPLPPDVQLLPGFTDPSGSHPFLPDASVNALAVRCKALLDQTFGLLHQYRPSTAPSTQLRIPPMNWELAMEILAENGVVDSTVIERTQARLEKIFGPRKTQRFHNTSASDGPSGSGSASKSADSAPPRNYLSYLNDDLAFLDNAQQIHQRLQAKKDAQQLLLKLTRRNLNKSEVEPDHELGSGSDSTPESRQQSESPKNANTENGRVSKSPAPEEEEPEDRMSIAESPPASSETSSTGDDGGKQYQDDRATPEVSYAANEVQVRQPSTTDESPSKTVSGWAVHVPLEESEESADEGAEEEQTAQGILPADEEVDELEADAGSDEMEDDEDDYERVPKPLETDPETHSDPLFPGDVQSGSDESESVDETSDDDDAVDENLDGEDSESESDQGMDDREDRLGPPLNQSSLAKGPPESDSDEESDVIGDDAAPTPAKNTLPVGLGGVVRVGRIEKEYEEDSDEEEPEQQADPAESEDDDVENHSSPSPAPASSAMPIGAIPKVTGEDESVFDSAEEAESDEEMEDSDELESLNTRAVGDREGDEEDEEDDSSEEKNYTANLPQPPPLNESGARVDEHVSDEELIGDGGNVVQEQWRKSPSSSASEHGVALDDEEVEEESEWEGVAKGDSESESEVEGCD